MKAGALIQRIGAVFAVPQQRMPDGRQMRPDLVGAPSQQMHLQQRQAVFLLEHLVFGQNGAPAWHRMGQHRHLIACLVLLQITLQHRVRRLWRTVYNAQVVFLDFPILELLVEDPQRRRRFGSDHDAAGVAVDAVDQRGGKAVFLCGVVFAFFV